MFGLAQKKRAAGVLMCTKHRECVVLCEDLTDLNQEEYKGAYSSARKELPSTPIFHIAVLKEIA